MLVDFCFALSSSVFNETIPQRHCSTVGAAEIVDKLTPRHWGSNCVVREIRDDIHDQYHSSETLFSTIKICCISNLLSQTSNLDLMGTRSCQICFAVNFMFDVPMESDIAHAN